MNEFTPTHCPFCFKRVAKLTEKFNYVKCYFCKNDGYDAFQVKFILNKGLFIILKLNKYQIDINYYENKTYLFSKENNQFNSTLIHTFNYAVNYFDPEALTKTLRTYIIFL